MESAGMAKQSAHRLSALQKLASSSNGDLFHSQHQDNEWERVRLQHAHGITFVMGYVCMFVPYILRAVQRGLFSPRRRICCSRILTGRGLSTVATGCVPLGLCSEMSVPKPVGSHNGTPMRSHRGSKCSVNHEAICRCYLIFFDTWIL